MFDKKLNDLSLKATFAYMDMKDAQFFLNKALDKPYSQRTIATNRNLEAELHDFERKKSSYDFTNAQLDSYRAKKKQF